MKLCWYNGVTVAILDVCVYLKIGFIQLCNSMKFKTSTFTVFYIKESVFKGPDLCYSL